MRLFLFISFLFICAPTQWSLADPPSTIPNQAQQNNPFFNANGNNGNNANANNGNANGNNGVTGGGLSPDILNPPIVDTIALGIYINGDINSVQSSSLLSGRFAYSEGNSHLILTNQNDVLIS